MGEVVDGEYQKYAVESGEYVRKHFWGAHPKLLEMVAHLSDEQLKKLTLGGHDPIKVYTAYKAAVEHAGQPTVILARTIKGYGIGEAGEAQPLGGVPALAEFCASLGCQPPLRRVGQQHATPNH